MFHVQRLYIDAPALRMGYYRVPWDSEIFGHEVAHIDEIELRGATSAARGAFLQFDDWCRLQHIELVACKLDHLRLRELAFLCEQGFRFIETMFYPRLENFPTDPAPPGAPIIEVSPIAVDDVEEIQRIAANAFITSRFVIDPWIAPELGAKRYQVWVSNSFADPAQKILKASISGVIVGFFIVEARADGSVYWHLTAVAPDFQGRGVGKALWSRMLRWHAERGATRIETAVSGHNLPVISMYGGLGFRLIRADVTLHRGELRAPYNE